MSTTVFVSEKSNQAIKMPKCCCCSVRTGLLIWITLSIISNLWSLIRNPGGAVNYVTYGLGLVVNLFGFYATYGAKRVLVKTFGYIQLFIAILGVGLGCFVIFSPNTKEVVKQALEASITNSDGIKVDLDEAWKQAQLLLIAALVVSFLIQMLILAYVRLYYKYLVKLEKSGTIAKP